MKNALSLLKEKWFTVFLVIVIVALIVIVLFRPNNNGVASAPEAGSLVQQPGQLNQAAIVPAGTTTFCFRLDGREDGHLPALMGSAAQNAYPNGLNGSNWSLPSNATGSEPYGIMPNGTIFAKVTFLKEYGMVSFCELKADRTSWQAEKGTEETIDGEEAIVWK